MGWPIEVISHLSLFPQVYYKHKTLIMKVNAWKLEVLPTSVFEFASEERYKDGKSLFTGNNDVGWCTTKKGIAYIGDTNSVDDSIISTLNFVEFKIGVQKSLIHSRIKGYFRELGFMYSKRSDLFFLPKSSRTDAVSYSELSDIYINSGFKYSIEKLANRFVLLINPFQVTTKDGEVYNTKFSKNNNSKVLADPYISPKYKTMVDMYKFLMSIIAPDGIINISCGRMGIISAVGSGVLKHSLIQEPSAYFGSSKVHQWPKLGLNRFGPLDYNIGKSTTPTEVMVAFIGSERSFGFLKKLKNGNTQGKYPFRGFDSVFYSNLSMGPDRYVNISSMEIESASSVDNIVDIIISKIVQLKNKDIDFDIALVELPLAWSEYYIGQVKDLHDIIKVKAYGIGVATQLFQEDDFENQSIDDLLSNLSLGIYHKAGGEPWRVETEFESVAYVGISFGYSEDDKKRLIGVAEIFDTYGQFISIRSLTVKEKEMGEYFDMYKHSHLDEQQLHDLLNNLLTDYRDFMDGSFPENLVIHKTTYFNAAEQDAVESLSNIPTQITMVYAQASHNWHVIDNKEPTRGFYLRLSSRKLLLYSSGILQGQKNYTLPGAPKPYIIEIQGDGNYTVEEIAQQIMELSKLNYNSTNSYSRHPVTLLHSKKIVNLLRAGLSASDIPTDPRYYI